jgi:hypothetical protein
VSEPRNTELFNSFMSSPDNKGLHPYRTQAALVLACERIEELEADVASEIRWAKEYLARAEKAEKEAERLRDAAIITDTNGMRCLFCEGQDDDYEGVVHKDDCPLKDGPKCQP